METLVPFRAKRIQHFSARPRLSFLSYLSTCLAPAYILFTIWRAGIATTLKRPFRHSLVEACNGRGVEGQRELLKARAPCCCGCGLWPGGAAPPRRAPCKSTGRASPAARRGSSFPARCSPRPGPRAPSPGTPVGFKPAACRTCPRMSAKSCAQAGAEGPTTSVSSTSSCTPASFSTQASSSTVLPSSSFC